MAASPAVKPQTPGRNLRLKPLKREAPALSPEKENKNREAQVLPSQSALPPQNNALEEFAFATTIQALESLGSLHESVVVTPRDVFPVSYSARSLDKSQEGVALMHQTTIFYDGLSVLGSKPQFQQHGCSAHASDSEELRLFIERANGFYFLFCE